MSDTTHKPERDPRPSDPNPAADTTAEVGSEGGSPGDVEIEKSRRGTGSESTETWQPIERRREIARDETGVGRRSPTEPEP